MPRIRNLIQNGTVVEQPIYNNVELTKWIHNGVVVWEKGAYQLDVLGEKQFTDMIGYYYNSYVSDRKYLTGEIAPRPYSEGDTFEINGITCTMKADGVFNLNGQATALTTIPYFITTLQIPPMDDHRNDDVDIIGYGLPYDTKPNTLSMKISSGGTDAFDYGKGCTLDLNGATGDVSVSCALIVQEDARLMSVDVTPTVRAIYQGRIYWLQQYEGSRKVTCRRVRYKELYKYIINEGSAPTKEEMWTDNNYRLDIDNLHLYSTEPSDYYSIRASVFSPEDNTRKTLDWIIGNDFANYRWGLRSPFTQKMFVGYNPLPTPSLMEMGIMDVWDYTSKSGVITGLRQQLGTGKGGAIIEANGNSITTMLRANISGFTFYDGSFQEINIGTFPTNTIKVWYYEDFFIILVRISSYHYKLEKFNFDGTETEIYTFNGFVIEEHWEDNVFDYIEYSGNYIFFIVTDATDPYLSDPRLVIVDRKCNVYITETNVRYQSTMLCIGNMIFNTGNMDDSIIYIDAPIR